MLPRHLKAQQTLAPVIGILDSSAATALKLSTFYEGLKVEGFFRNQNLTVEYHSAEGDYARLSELAADLVNRRVALITALGNPAALAAKAATTKIPVVFAVSANPIEIGLVASLNHPGANMTGVAGMAAGREQKRLELLYAAVPTAAGLGFPLDREFKPGCPSRSVELSLIPLDNGATRHGCSLQRDYVIHAPRRSPCRRNAGQDDVEGPESSCTTQNSGDSRGV